MKMQDSLFKASSEFESVTATPLTSMWGFRMSRALCGCAGCVQQKQILCTCLASLCSSRSLPVTQAGLFIISIYLTLSYTASRRQSQGLNPDGLIPPLNHAHVPYWLWDISSLSWRYYLGMCVLFHWSAASCPSKLLGIIRTTWFHVDSMPSDSFSEYSYLVLPINPFRLTLE